MPNTYIFISRSGGGKGTQAKLLTEYLQKETPDTKVFYMYTGSEFRKFIQGESFTKHRSKEVYEAGGRQPDYLAIYMWARVLSDEFKGTEHLIFDGTPRSENEAKVLGTALQFFGREHVHIIHLTVSREWSMERLLGRGRSDDDPLEITKRLDWYDKDVTPALEFYRGNPMYVLHDINGEQTIEEVHDDIVENIESRIMN